MVLRLESQIRYVSLPDGIRAAGFDQASALRLADALGVNQTLVALVLPAIEAIACAKINEQMRES
ncbi:hypothetical protein SL1157_1670 [Ruegeria lacuscaerulensis ITI-1157]|nr:hypothetical protein SL1157_1670 [Ruegeria lacuscaerulensis ITI-1157]